MIQEGRGSVGRLAVLFVVVAFALAGVVHPADARGGHGGGHGGRGGGAHGGAAHGGHVHHFRFGHHGFVFGLGADLFYPFPYYSPYYYNPYCYYDDPYCSYDPYYYYPRYDPYDYGSPDAYPAPYEPSMPAVPESSQGIPSPQAPLQTGSTPPPQPLFCWDVGSLRWQPCPIQRGAPPSPSTASGSSGAPGLN
jgi:hypothetical protein